MTKKHIKIITLFLFKYMIKDIFFKIKNKIKNEN
jgi:hypothetical protein